MTIDPTRHTVSWEGRTVELTPAMSRLLVLLADRGDVVGRDQLIAAVWGERDAGVPTSAAGILDVLIHGLRRRLASAGFPGKVRTWPRAGYELVLS